jgi:hypothetical protein
LVYSCSIIIGHNVYSTVTIHFHSIYIYIYTMSTVLLLYISILYIYIEYYGQYCYYTFPFLILPPPPSLLRLYKFQRTKVVFKLWGLICKSMSWHPKLVGSNSPHK